MELNQNNCIGLMVGRFQPLHAGHTKIINKMIQDCSTAIVCMGSAQKSRELHDPWTVEERMQMLRNVYADRIKVIPLKDLGAAHPNQWVGYIFDKIVKLGMKEPAEYYTGSAADGQWYKLHFWSEDFVRLGFDPAKTAGQYNSDGILRKMHIIDRNANPIAPAATEIRTWLETRSDGWKEWTPAVNHDLIEKTYPEEFKIPLG